MATSSGASGGGLPLNPDGTVNVSGSLQTGQAYVNPTDPPVFMGTAGSTAHRYAGKALPDGVVPDIAAPHLNVRPMSSVIEDIYGTSFDLRKWTSLMEKNHIIEPGQYNFDDLTKLWAQAVEMASHFYGRGKQQKTPWDMVPMLAMAGGQAGATKKTNTTTSTNLTTRAESRASLTNIYAQELGRSPTKREVRAFHMALQAKERSNPSVTTNVSQDTGVSGVSSTSDVTSTGGVNPSAFAQNYVQDTNNAELDDRHAATTYYDALLGLAQGGL